MTSLSESNSFVVVWSAFKWIKVRESKLRLDWWGSGIDWGEWGDAAVKRMAFVRRSIFMTGRTSISRAKFPKEGTTAVMQNMRKQTSNVHVNKSRVKKNSGILFTRFQDKLKNHLLVSQRSILAGLKWSAFINYCNLKLQLDPWSVRKIILIHKKNIIEPLVK